MSGLNNILISKAIKVSLQFSRLFESSCHEFRTGVKYKYRSAGWLLDISCVAVSGGSVVNPIPLELSDNSLFSFDVRDRPMSIARVYSDQTLFDEPTRAVMNVTRSPASLLISKLIPADSGEGK